MRSNTLVILLSLVASGLVIGVGLGAVPRTNSTVPLNVSAPESSARETGSAGDQDVLIGVGQASAAPEIAAGKWINSDPLSLKGLRGKVVLVDFWTFGCFNCVNTLPTLKGFHEKYDDKGLRIIGVEKPELSFERSFDNLVAAVAKRGIKYPVVTDYEDKTWDAYGINAWPTVVIVDKGGRIRYIHEGEGQYDTQEKIIRKLLAEDEKGNPISGAE